MKKITTSLMLSQSYKDSYDDYVRSLDKVAFPRWDAIVITASNELQALGYQKQLDMRASQSRLPYGTDFIIVPDKDNKRVGSAGSTLSVIRELKSKYGDFAGKKFLCIHAGGDSKRVPQYSALGKLFSPVPTMVGGASATLFDMFLISMASVPSRLREGMLLLSGDVILLFNPLMCDFGTSDAAVISFKEPVETGKNHGVYLKSSDGFVKRFLHKQTVETLTQAGAVDERGNCSIDTGAIELSPKILDALYNLIAPTESIPLENDLKATRSQNAPCQRGDGPRSGEGIQPSPMGKVSAKQTEEAYDSIVNDKVRLSLYGDIAYCLADDSTLEQLQKEQPEGEFCDELAVAREKLWNAIGSFRVKLLNIAPAKFVHFGTTAEIMKLMSGGVNDYAELGWSKVVNSSITKNVAGYNSILSQMATIGKDCYLECSYVHRNATIGNNVVLSFVDIHDETIPDNVVVHALKLNDGRFVCRIFGINDNPKNKIEDTSLSSAAKALAISDITLWEAPLYPICKTVKEALEESLKLYNGECVKDTGKRTSLKDSFNQADPSSILEWDNRMHELVQMNNVLKYINEKKSVDNAIDILKNNPLTPIQVKWLEHRLQKSDFSEKIRLLYYIGIGTGDSSYIKKCFSTIADTVLNSALKSVSYDDSLIIAKDESIVKLPLRVNWGGGWSDTPPYCMENGGTVLNASIKLNGELPIESRLVKIKDKKIVFESKDMGVYGEFTDIADLQNTGDPYDSFALQKACLIACGVIPKSGGNLDQILTRMGGGFELHSEVTGVPKGSGLGTSSILSAACVKAVFEFVGKKYTEDDLYATVLVMEQIMSTGGGWQDQVGGVVNGIKLVSSKPGIDQELSVEHVNVSKSTLDELNKRLCLIYTGQRRLARNLLRDVVGRYVGNIQESVSAHNEIQRLAVLMKFELERGNIDEFAKLMNEHWEYSKQIDAGSSNTLIDHIFMCIDDLIDAKLVCGAGGGGFVQVILKLGVTKIDVHNRLKEVFQDFDVDVWNSEIV